MNYDYVLNTNSIEKYKNDFQIIIDKVERTISLLNSSSLSRCTNSKIIEGYNSINGKLNSIKESMSSINNIWEEYYNEICNLEKQISTFTMDGIDNPSGVDIKFQTSIDDIIDPVLYGNEIDNRNLGYKQEKEEV